MKKNNEVNKLVGTFVVGTAIGAGLGVLFAPRKGSETRQILKSKMDEFVVNLKEIDVNEVKKNIESKINEIKAELKSLDKEKVLEIAKAKGDQLKEKTIELVEMAKDKGTPVLQDLALSIMHKTDEVITENINKLEGSKKEEAPKKTVKKKKD